MCAAQCHRAQPSGPAGALQILHAWRQRFGCTHQAVGHRGWQTLSRTPGPRVAGTARQWRDTCPACADNLITRCVSVCAQHSCHLRQACGLDASGPGHCLRKLCTALPCAQARHRAAARDGRNPQELGSYTVVASRALVTDGHESKLAEQRGTTRGSILVQTASMYQSGLTLTHSCPWMDVCEAGPANANATGVPCCALVTGANPAVRPSQVQTRPRVRLARAVDS